MPARAINKGSERRSRNPIQGHDYLPREGRTVNAVTLSLLGCQGARRTLLGRVLRLLKIRLGRQAGIVVLDHTSSTSSVASPLISWGTAWAPAWLCSRSIPLAVGDHVSHLVDVVVCHRYALVLEEVTEEVQ